MTAIPPWAAAQVAVIAETTDAARLFARRYTRGDGEIDFRGELDDSRDGGDDFLEPFAQWPLLALMSGDATLAADAGRHYRAVARQLDALGFTDEGIDLGTDWFHLGEGNELLYHLCVLDPSTDMVHRAVAHARASLGDNYDAERNLIRAPHPGAHGPRWGYKKAVPEIMWRPDMSRYGIPFPDIEGVGHYDDLHGSTASKAMATAMEERFGRGDVAMNLSATGVAFNAWLLTGDDRYSRWIERYTEGWIERARANDGIVPDNVGLDGETGSGHGGRWWGGLYGWAWPHGAHSVLNAVAVSSIAAYQVSGDDRYLDFIRDQFDALVERGHVGRLADATGALRREFLSRFDDDEHDAEALLIPHRFGPDGWFDFLPVEPTIPAAIWQLTGSDADWSRIEHLRRSSTYDWNRVRPSRLKEDSGHEEPWLRYLAGANPDYPSTAMAAASEVVRARLAMIAADPPNENLDDIHHWQKLNPVSTEHLLQVRTGGPSPLYYGGHVQSTLRVLARDAHADLTDLAVAVSHIGATTVTATVANTSVEPLHLDVFAGAYGEHRITAATLDATAVAHQGRSVPLTIPAATAAVLELGITRRANTPTARLR